MMWHKLTCGLLVLSPCFAFGGAGAVVSSSWIGSEDLAEDVLATNVDCREVIPVASFESAALKGLTYSSLGWDLDPAEDASRTVTIVARPGTLAGGRFTPDGGAEVTVLAETAGRGAVDWRLLTVEKKVYQLVHTVKAGGAVDAAETLYGYLDFTYCDRQATQDEFEAAVLAEFTHEIAAEQDADAPWQPVDWFAARSGVTTDAELESGTVTETRFSFSGIGVFAYEYALSGGTLEIVVDGQATELALTGGDWVAGSVPVTAGGAHTVVFAYQAAGDGSVAQLRRVRWDEPLLLTRTEVLQNGVPLDLREGVRTPQLFAEVFPFEYSSTNWIGDVEGVGVGSVARVAIVRLTGEDPDVSTWTETVPKSSRELVRKAGEGQVRWNPRQGVWKATFDILNGDDSIHSETAIFDLRDAHGGGNVGFAILLK